MPEMDPAHFYNAVIRNTHYLPQDGAKELNHMAGV